MSRYKQHKTDFEVVPSERPLTLPCRVRGCHCPAYQYVPRIGPNPVHCRCKHLPQDHSEATGHLCKKCESEITIFKDNGSVLRWNLGNIYSSCSRSFSQTCFPITHFQALPVLGSRAPSPVCVARPALPTRPW